ncbi:LemA family protein [Pedobacter frigiditerrae]|uniref:LemA family protein n=1 Tax=Pedobacter frigiditerrae TaxID=2530452 RepID=UPI002930EFB0|nr:LemA family protein [Pedobacter frigiditerrae]
MKKPVIFGIIGVVILIALIGGCNSYNGLVASDVEVQNKWSQVETQYQRRSDLIPNLVSTVKGAAKFEQGTLTAVVEARAKASQIKVDPSQLTPENIAKYQQAQGQVGQALSRLMVLTENYPELKATQQFSDLSVALEGTENRIATSRKDFNDAVKGYNTSIRSFPSNIWAKMFGFKEKSGFVAEVGAEKAPTVAF